MFISESFSVASLLSRNKNFKSALSYFYRSSFCSFCLVVSLLLQKAFPSTGDLEHTATSSERCMHWQKIRSWWYCCCCSPFKPLSLPLSISDFGKHMVNFINVWEQDKESKEWCCFFHTIYDTTVVLGNDWATLTSSKQTFQHHPWGDVKR